MAETQLFDSATEYALLAFIEETPITTDPNTGWTRHSEMMGARRVLEILRTIHVPQVAPRPMKTPRLNPVE